jgi:hypothetical protein
VRLCLVGVLGTMTLFPGSSSSVDRFLAQKEPPLMRAVAYRHMVATARGGSLVGWMDACTVLDGTDFRYKVLAEGGSSAIRKRALVAALEGETKARRQGNAWRSSLDTSNYEFVPAGIADGLARIRLTPKRKDSMLVDGTMFLAGQTGDLVRIEGRLIKPPSFWTRDVEIVQRYARVAGIRVPVHLESRASVLVVGTSTMSVSYAYLSVNDRTVDGGDARRARGCSPASIDAETASTHHERAVGFHLRRSLDEASAEYAATLTADPPRPPTAAEQRLVERFAPRVFVTSSEPFGLRDVAAVMHPDQPLIAYHLLWDDDIDYPDDNDPSDHEVVWVRYRPDGSLDRFWTYFHGRILDGGEAAIADAQAHEMRPAVFVQWGKHGSMPIEWRSIPIEADWSETEASYYPTGVPITLERYNQGTYRKLSTEGTREAGHPLARRGGWPSRFSGTWDDFVRFDRLVDVKARLHPGSMVLVSRWNSATLNQSFLRYNFKPKTEWPADAR